MRNYYKVVLYVFLVNCPLIIAVSWTLSTVPAVFGKDVQLTCNLTTGAMCCDAFTRKWSAGRNFDLLIMNGASSDKLKYTEMLNATMKTSTLIIKNFTLDDVNIPYECTYGFSTASKVLKITEETFEFLPIEFIPVNLTLEEDVYVKLNISFYRVFPTPYCIATEDTKNISRNLTVVSGPNGILYTTNILFYYNTQDSCFRNISVACSVGKTNLLIGSRYITHVFCTDSTDSGNVLVQIIVPLCVLLIIIIGIVIYWRKHTGSSYSLVNELPVFCCKRRPDSSRQTQPANVGPQIPLV